MNRSTRTSSGPHERARRLFDAGRFVEAAQACAQAAKGNKRDPRLLWLWGASLARAGALGRACITLRKAIALAPTDPDLHLELALALHAAGSIQQANESLDRCLAIRPGYVPALSSKAHVLLSEGRAQEARQLLAPGAQEDRPDLVLATTFARACQATGRHREGVEALDSALSVGDAAPIVRRQALFRLALLHDALGESALAFERATQANALKPDRFDPRRHEQRIDRLIHTWTPDRIAHLPRVGRESELPVFIVGMPRSGTSLVEQIVASHPRAAGAGELPLVEAFVERIEATPPAGVAMLSEPGLIQQRDLDRFASTYLQRLAGVDASAARVTDKFPMNAMHLGLIAAAFPGCRVIHCTRDARDACLSCYFQDFAGRVPFAQDLEHLGVFHRCYRRLVEHWNRVLDLAILDVEYERLVREPEEQIRRMLDFLGLEYSDRCVRFHEHDRAVLTLSADQVRRPIYSTAIGRAERYAPYLEPLERGLGSAE